VPDVCLHSNSDSTFVADVVCKKTLLAIDASCLRDLNPLTLPFFWQWLSFLPILDRAELLRGIIDYGGYRDHEAGVMTYKPTLSSMARSLRELVWSLGGVVRMQCSDGDVTLTIAFPPHSQVFPDFKFDIASGDSEEHGHFTRRW